jgi:dTDP-4-amino-4,6-dideoxygalactose transaminase
LPATIPLNDLKRAAVNEQAALSEAIGRVVDSGWYVNGPELAGFEAEFAAYTGVAHVLGVASGTDALEIALRAVGCVRGSRVLMAANAGFYAATAALRLGAEPVYADVDADTMALSAETVATALDGVDCVVVTHLYGRLADVEALAAICRSKGVPLLEDCAQSAGAVRGGHAGTFGDVGTFSFYPTKNLGALGDGGAIITGDAALADRVRRLRQYGWSEKYVVADLGGVNSRLDELQAAVLRLRLSGLDDANARRRSIVERYAAALPASAGSIPRASDRSYVAHLAVAVCEDRSALAEMLRAAGIETGVHYPIPDHRQPALPRAVQLPVTEHLAASVLTLPCFPELVESEIARVCDALHAVAGRTP